MSPRLPLDYVEQRRKGVPTSVTGSCEGEKGERPERPPMLEGEEGERPEGEEGKRHNDKLMKEMNFDEQEIEIALSEYVEIHIGGEEQGTINDIQSDDVIKIYYAEDGETVESIFIRK